MAKYSCPDCGTKMKDYGVDYLCPKCPVFTDKHYRRTIAVIHWAYKPYVTHKNYRKCGLCWQQKILSDVCKEFLSKKNYVTKTDLRRIEAERKRRWRKTSLYKHVRLMLKKHGDLEIVGKEMLKNGIEI